MSLALEPLEGKYEIVARLKEGGMGAIYKVRHRLLEEIRVVKVLRQQFEDDADLNTRFIHEARAAIRLRHPNVVQIFDFLLEGGVGYIVMEFIDGVDLADLIKRGSGPSLPLFLEVARQGLRALGYLHQQGFVHRDISPDNLMLCRDFAGRPLVKMIDLGIAKQVDGKGVNLTASGTFLGKFRYSSPEHFGSRGSGGIEARSDLYSYGVVLYEFLTGRYPIRGEGSSQLIAGHLFHPPLAFDEADPEGRVPRAVREILSRVLDKDPDKRFASAADFAAALQPLRAQFPVTEAVAEEAKVIAVQEGEDEAVDPGSTQDRLDRAFVHPTPAPPSDAEAEGDSGPDAGEALPGGDLERLFERHLEAACTLAGEGGYAEALPHFEAALRVQPGNEAVRNMLAETREHFEEERKTSQTRLDGEVRQLRELLAAGETEALRQRLASARRAYGNAATLAEVEAELDAEERSRRRREVEEALAEAVGLRHADELTGALRTLERAREALRGVASGESEADHELLGRLDQEEAVLEEALRGLAELEEAAFGVSELMAAGKLVEADRALFQALELFGPRPRLQELRRALDQLHRRGLMQQMRSLLDQAVARAASGELAEARQALEKAAVLAPADSGLEDDLEGLRAVLDGGGEGAGELIRERVHALVQEAGVHFEAGRYADALPLLERAHELTPGDSWIAARMGQARSSAGERVG